MTAPRYSLAERDRRWALARRFMEIHYVSALVVFGDHEDNGAAPYTYDHWFTNDRPGSTVVFPRHGSPNMLIAIPACATDNMYATLSGETPWVRPSDIHVGRHAQRLISILQQLQLVQGAIGVLGLEPYLPVYPDGIIPYSMWTQVLSAFPNVSFRPLGLEFGKFIIRLGDEQQSILRHATAIGDAMAAEMVRVAGVNVPESDLLKAAMGTGYGCGTAVPMLHLKSGPNAINWGPPRWTYSPQEQPRLLLAGDVVSSELFINYGGIAAQVQVTIAIGNVHPDVERAALVARECYDAGLKALVASARFGDVVAAMVDPVIKAGGWSKGPQLHSLNPIMAIGSTNVDLAILGASHDYPSAAGMKTRHADLVLEPGMSFAFEPSCFFGTHGLCIGGTVLVGDKAPIELNPSTARLLRAGP